ncbi:MAG TPA: ARC6/PARC6 family protein, partial [Chroococcidiopsis sp.]
SGLSVDDFLRFIQQLRSYLTVGEQHGLFESEARRPSAVATYLAVYALLARGFAEGQPALIRRAKLMLVRLGSRQDIHLEQAICALLLGQTEEASRALELSQEYESIAFIREHSQGSPDLLPGLCLYAEQWLQTEVFPQFRDLADQRASLKDYFADEAVQSYLEELPNEPEPASQWALGRSQFATNGSAASSQDSARRMAYGEDTRTSSAPRSATSTAVLDTDVRAAASNGSAMPTAERVSNQSSDDRSNGGASMTTGGGRPGQPSSTLPSRRRGPGGTPAARSDQSPPSRFSNRRRNGLRLDRLMFLVATGFVGLGVLILIGSRLTQAASGGSEPRQTSQEGLAPALLLVAQPPKPAPTAATGALDEQKAKEVLETWLAAKSLAFGQTHDTTKLAQILVDPALTQWQANAEEAKAANAYSEYVHTVKVTAVTSAPETPDLAQVEAEVTESSKYYIDGQLDVERSADDNLSVRYTLVRQNNQWFIQDWAASPL